MRKQIQDELKTNAGKSDVIAALHEMDKKMLDVELKLLSKSDLHSDDKWFVEAYKVYLNLLWLSAQVGLGGGDAAGGADYRPTDTQVQVLQLLEQQLKDAKAAFDKLMETEVPAFNNMMSGKVKAIAM
jgi:hypothetical protein